MFDPRTARERCGAQALPRYMDGRLPRSQTECGDNAEKTGVLRDSSVPSEAQRQLADQSTHEKPGLLLAALCDARKAGCEAKSQGGGPQVRPFFDQRQRHT
jgi:hypothetical protein